MYRAQGLGFRARKRGQTGLGRRPCVSKAYLPRAGESGCGTRTRRHSVPRCHPRSGRDSRCGLRAWPLRVEGDPVRGRPVSCTESRATTLLVNSGRPHRPGGRPFEVVTRSSVATRRTGCRAVPPLRAAPVLGEFGHQGVGGRQHHPGRLHPPPTRLLRQGERRPPGVQHRLHPEESSSSGRALRPGERGGTIPGEVPAELVGTRKCPSHPKDPSIG